MTQPFYKTLLGDEFHQLPEKIQEMHVGVRRAEGKADIKRGTSVLAKLICAIARVPNSGEGVDIITTFEPVERGERWTRSFQGQEFSTVLQVDTTNDGPTLTEKFGPFVFGLRVIAHEHGIDLIPESVKLWAIPVPKMLCPEAIGLERVKNDLYHFDVSVRVPLVGEIVSYDGYLSPVA